MPELEEELEEENPTEDEPTEPTVLDIVRTALRRTTTDLDALELTPLIEAAKLDLEGAGVIQPDDTDPLIRSAITLFCLYRIEKDEREYKFYTDLKQMIATNSDYNEQPL